VLDRLLDLIAPVTCAFCEAEDEGVPVCSRCLAILPWIGDGCHRCGRELSPAGATCGECQRSPPAWQRARAAARYEFPIDAALIELKFRRKLHYAPAFASLLAPLVTRNFAGCDALVPVPLHRLRLARRGYNQAEELCRPLGRATGLPVLMQARRTRPTKAQSGLEAAERRRNLRNAFAVRGPLEARYPLVVDDVITTGSTAGELATALLAAGAEKVGVIAVARSSGSLKV